MAVSDIKLCYGPVVVHNLEWLNLDLSPEFSGVKQVNLLAPLPLPLNEARNPTD